MKPRPHRGRGATAVTLLAMVGLATVAMFVAYGSPGNGVDDAQIFLVYADNLARGAGFVYNAGGERVEGASSLLWTLVCTAAVLSGQRPESVLLGLGVLLGAATLFLASAMIVRAADAPRAWYAIGVGTGIVALASGSWVVWSVLSLMEVGLWGALVAAAGALLLATTPRARARDTAAAATIGALMLLTRPEAMLVAPCLALGRLWIRWPVVAARQPVRRAFVLEMAVLVATAVLLTLLRLWYFGFPFPNTYYAKVSPVLSYNIGLGSGYLISFLRSNPLAAICVLVAVGIAIAIALRRGGGVGENRGLSLEERRWLAGAAFSALLLALPLATGGDHFGLHRLYQPLWPLLIAVAAAGVLLPALEAKARLRDRPALRRVALCGLALLVASEALLAGTGWRRSAFPPALVDFAIANYERWSGRVAAEMFAPLSSRPGVAIVAAGGFKRSYPGEVLDLFGLNHVAMGHARGDRIGIKSHASFDAAVFFEELPEIMVPRSGEADSRERPETLISSEQARLWDAGYFRGMLHGERFQALYRYARVWRAGGGPYFVEGYYRRDYLDGLRFNPQFRVEDVTMSERGVW